MGYWEDKAMKASQARHKVLLRESKTVADAKRYLRKNLDATHAILVSGDALSMDQLKNLFQAEASGEKRLDVFNSIERKIEQATALQEQQSAQRKRHQASSQIYRESKKFVGLSANELLDAAQEMTEPQVEALLEWERGGKNRLSVVRGLSAMLVQVSGPSAVQGTEGNQVDATELALANRAAEEANKGVWKKRRGTLRLVCQACSHTNSVDFELLQSVVSRQQNTARGRIERLQARNMESGLRLSGRHGAASTVKANEINMARLVSDGFSCSKCRASLSN